MTLRTLHLTNAWHPNSGGIATFYRALLATANEVGWRARLIVPAEDSGFEPVGAFAGIYYVKAPRAPISPDYRMMYPHRYLAPGGEIRLIMRDERPDLVEICDKYTLPYLGGMLRRGWMPGVARPAVVGLSCERFDDNVAAYAAGNSQAKKLAAAYVKYIYFALFDHHVAVSSYTAEELEQASHGHDVRRGVWIRPMGVEVDLFHPSRAGAGKRSDLCTRMGAPERSRLLLYAGRLAPEKNLPLLIQTARLLGPEYHWLIAGSGPARDSLCEQLGQCASFTYLGHISDREALADLFANVDAFVHPNPREPFGIAPLEVMASGTPLVGSNEGGVATYANESNAWLAAPAPQAFAAAVRQIFSDDKDRAKRLCHARQTAERYSWSAACLRFHELYRELVARTRDGAHAGCEPAFYSTSPVR